jgi:hypothetical protein
MDRPEEGEANLLATGQRLSEWMNEWMNEWLLFNAKWVIFQLFQGVNNYFDNIMMKSTLY